MPFAETLRSLYNEIIRPTVESAGMRCERADELALPTVITRDIWERVNRARFIIADLTGQNANVFYELGLAHAIGRDAILLTQSMDFVPFDLRSIRCIVYNQTSAGLDALRQKLTTTVAGVIAGLESTSG